VLVAGARNHLITCSSMHLDWNYPHGGVGSQPPMPNATLRETPTATTPPLRRRSCSDVNFRLAFRRGRRRPCRSVPPKGDRRSGIDELHVDAQPIAAALHAALQDIAHDEFAPDLLEVDRFVLYVKAVFRPMTNAPKIRERSVVRLSVIQSTK
jgi:hypothetical protein